MVRSPLSHSSGRTTDTQRDPASCDHLVVRLFRTPRRALKRGGLIAAANWPIVFVQGSADALFKLVVTVPIVGGVFLGALIVGAEPRALLGLDYRDLPGTLLALLVARPLALASFLAALAVATVGGSVFIFLIKGGTVALLVRAEREAAAIEEPPLDAAAVARASVFSIEGFIEASRDLFPRYLRLGGVLLLAYVASGLVFLAVAFGGVVGDGWFTPLLATVVFVVWMTAVNLVYLLAQIVMAAEACNVAVALRRVTGFVRKMPRTVGGVCLVVLGLIVLITIAGVVAATALGLIGFVPFVGLAVFPLQLLALLLRGLVLQYVALASIGAYSALYRGHASESAAPAERLQAPQPVRAEAG